MSLVIRRINLILQKKNRYLLHVFSLDRDNNVAETIFRAIFGERTRRILNPLFDKIVFFLVQIETTETDTMSDPMFQAQKRWNDEDRLIDLAVEWNYFDGVLPILKSRADEKFHRDCTSPNV